MSIKIEVLMISQLITEAIFFSYLLLMYLRSLKEVKGFEYFILYRGMNIISLFSLIVLTKDSLPIFYIVAYMFILFGALLFGVGYARITNTKFNKSFFIFISLLYIVGNLFSISTKSTLFTTQVIASITLTLVYLSIILQNLRQPNTSHKKRYRILMIITWVHVLLYILNTYYSLKPTEKSLNYFHSSGFTVIFLIIIQLIAVTSTVVLVVKAQGTLLDKDS